MNDSDDDNVIVRSDNVNVGGSKRTLNEVINEQIEEVKRFKSVPLAMDFLRYIETSDDGKEITLNLSMGMVNRISKSKSFHKLINEYWQRMIEFLSHDKYITALNLAGQSSIRTTNMLQLMEMLKGNKTLTKLNLSASNQNRLTLEAMGEMLKENDTLKSINLSLCPLTNEQLLPLMSALKENTSVSHLGINKSITGRSSLEYILDCLSTNKTLLKIHFENAYERGVKRVLKENSPLVEEIKKALEANRERALMMHKIIHALLIIRKIRVKENLLATVPKPLLLSIIEFLKR